VNAERRLDLERVRVTDLTPDYGASVGLRQAVRLRFSVRMRQKLQARFYIDPATGSPHIRNHQVEEDEVIDVLEKPGEDRAGHEGSRVALGQTASGRYLRVVYVPDPEPDSVFVITAYEISGKSLAAYRKRRKKKHQ
jgi:hypothetical protein